MPVKKKPLKEDGFVFETTGGSVTDIDTSDMAGRSVSFDAHFITGKIMDFGKVLTGIPLYSNSLPRMAPIFTSWFSKAWAAGRPRATIRRG